MLAGRIRLRQRLLAPQTPSLRPTHPRTALAHFMTSPPSRSSSPKPASKLSADSAHTDKHPHHHHSVKDLLHKIVPSRSHDSISSNHSRSMSGSATPTSPTVEPVRLGPDGQPESTSARKKREAAEKKAAQKAKNQADRIAKEAEERAAREAADVDYATQNYGKLPLNQSQERTNNKRTKVIDISAANAGERVIIRARLQTTRAQGAKMAFVVLRQQDSTIQGLCQVEPVTVSKKMVRFVEGIHPESIVLVEGEVQKPLEEVKSCTVMDAEIKIHKIHIISEAPLMLPFTLADATRGESEASHSEGAHVALDTRLDNRVLDLRTITNQAIFKMSSGVCNLFREYLNNQGFIEIHSPKLQGAATESGASVFKVSYFKGKAFLAQSPQLAKQMAIAADFEKVYEIAPVFRAEDSNTHRHMTEFTGLDLEMAFEEHYHEVMETIDGMLKSIFAGLKDKYAHEISVIQRQHPHDIFTWPEKTLVLKYTEAIKILQDAGVQQGTPPAPIGDMDDMSTTTEKALGVLVKEKYGTDYYIIDKFPLALRPFYTMPDPNDPLLSNSYDFFMRGEEILSGAQRLHDAELLEERMRGVNINPADMKHYCDAFRLGAPPHAGGGIGLERVVMLFLKLGNIRRASLFPRDPKRLEP